MACKSSAGIVGVATPALADGLEDVVGVGVVPGSEVACSRLFASEWASVPLASDEDALIAEDMRLVIPASAASRSWRPMAM